MIIDIIIFKYNVDRLFKYQMEFREVPSRNGGMTRFYRFNGDLPDLVDKLRLNDRVIEMSYDEYQLLIPLMEKKFGKSLYRTCWGDPLTVFFTT